MGYEYQHGPVERQDAFDLAFDAEVSYAGRWHSVNDHFNYRVTPEGWGETEETYRRKEVQSDFFVGTYTVRSVPDSVKRTWEVRVMGQDMLHLIENVKNLKAWFTQDSFNIRWVANNYMETWLAERADMRTSMSHVLLHNCQAQVRLSFSTHPTVTSELVL